MSKEIWAKIMRTRERRQSQAQIGHLCKKCEQLQDDLAAAEKQIGWLKDDKVRLNRSVKVRDDMIDTVIDMNEKQEEQLQTQLATAKEENEKLRGPIKCETENCNELIHRQSYCPRCKKLWEK